MPMQEWTRQVGAKGGPTRPRPLNVTDDGAVGDGKTLNTKAIQAAIELPRRAVGS